MVYDKSNDKFKVTKESILVECSYCEMYGEESPSVALKSRNRDGNWQVSEFVQRGEEGYDFMIYKAGNGPKSHSLCLDCLDKLFED